MLSPVLAQIIALLLNNSLLTNEDHLALSKLLFWNPSVILSPINTAFILWTGTLILNFLTSTSPDVHITQGHPAPIPEVLLYVVIL